MEISYIGKILPNGNLSTDPDILPKLPKEGRIKVVVIPLPEDEDNSREVSSERDTDPATKRFLEQLRNAPKLGEVKGELSREAFYEEMADERF